MRKIVIADEFGNIIVDRSLKADEDPAAVFEQTEREHLKKLKDGN